MENQWNLKAVWVTFTVAACKTGRQLNKNDKKFTIFYAHINGWINKDVIPENSSHDL